MESDLFCCVCKEPSTGAHHCILCKKVTHAIPTCSTSSDLEEGYGSKVICNNCTDDEPPVKKTTTWCIRYPSVNDEPKRKIPKKQDSKSKALSENRCICITCFKNEVEPTVYVMSRRDNHTKERHLKRCHPGLTMGEIEIYNFECFGKDLSDAKKKYLEAQESKGEAAILKRKLDQKTPSQRLITTVSGHTTTSTMSHPQVNYCDIDNVFTLFIDACLCICMVALVCIYIYACVSTICIKQFNIC